MKGKKLLKVLSLVLIVCLFATLFVACNKKDEQTPGAIAGNYVAASEQTFTEAVGNIDTSKLLGDAKSENFKFGFQLKADLNASVSSGSDMYAKGSVKAEFGVTGTSTELADLKGAGSASVSYETKGIKGTEVSSGKISADAYILSSEEELFAYGIADMGKEEKAKAKIDVMQIVMGLMSASLSEEEADSAMTSQVAAIYQKLEQYKIGVALDQSSGLKIKLSITKDSVYAIIDAMLGEEKGPSAAEESEPSIKDFIKINKFDVNAYIAINADGTLSAVSVTADVDVKYDPPALETTDDASASVVGALRQGFAVTVKGYIMVEAKDVTVSLPENLATDTSYYDATEDLIRLIGSMM